MPISDPDRPLMHPFHTHTSPIRTQSLPVSPPLSSSRSVPSTRASRRSAFSPVRVRVVLDGPPSLSTTLIPVSDGSQSPGRPYVPLGDLTEPRSVRGLTGPLGRRQAGGGTNGSQVAKRSAEPRWTKPDRPAESPQFRPGLHPLSTHTWLGWGGCGLGPALPWSTKPGSYPICTQTEPLLPHWWPPCDPFLPTYLPILYP